MNLRIGVLQNSLLRARLADTERELSAEEGGRVHGDGSESSGEVGARGTCSCVLLLLLLQPDQYEASALGLTRIARPSSAPFHSAILSLPPYPPLMA